VGRFSWNSALVSSRGVSETRIIDVKTGNEVNAVSIIRSCYEGKAVDNRTFLVALINSSAKSNISNT
jgi:hypothetical protein